MIWTFSSRSLKKSRAKRDFVPTLFLFLLSAVALCAFRNVTAAERPDFPLFVANLPNPNDYTLFANSGWDGNWYVGYNTCWIKKLPPVPPGTYRRAYIGAKLGRAKYEPTGPRAWERQPIAGTFHVAVASVPAWSPAQAHVLTTTDEIVAEGEAENAVEGTGESHWFWVEVPLSEIHVGGDNFIALWSSTPSLISVSSSPVLAAGWGGKEVDTWLARDIHGAPPAVVQKDPGASVSYFQPAIALKLVPTGPAHVPRPAIVQWQGGTTTHPKPTLTATVAGESVERVWLEYEKPKASWKPIGRPLWTAPYTFSVDATKLPPGKVHLRVVAASVWGDAAATLPITVEVSARHEK